MGGAAPHAAVLPAPALTPEPPLPPTAPSHPGPIPPDCKKDTCKHVQTIKFDDYDPAPTDGNGTPLNSPYWQGLNFMGVLADTQTAGTGVVCECVGVERGVCGRRAGLGGPAAPRPSLGRDAAACSTPRSPLLAFPAARLHPPVSQCTRSTERGSGTTTSTPVAVLVGGYSASRRRYSVSLSPE